ncbi:MAG: glycosyltransferase [Candidatus Heimdallarchaeaceae archaeon]
MQILQIIPYFTPKRGGDVNVCYNLSKYLSEKGHSITILTTTFEFDKKYAKRLEKIGVEIIAFRHYMNLSLFLYSPAIRKWLRKNIKTFDIVHLHEFRSYQNIISHHFTKKFRIPYILQPHNSLPKTIRKSNLKRMYDLIWGNKILKDASKIIAVSNEEVENAIKRGIQKEKIALIYNGISSEIPKDLPKCGHFKRKYNIKGKMILYLGRIHELKGIDVVIRALYNLLKETDEDITFIIAGHDDGYGTELKRLIFELNMSNKVKFVGYLDNRDKISAYIDADLFVHTVRYMGGVGISPLEAILYGTPVIVTNECGELIKKTKIGYLVDYRDLDNIKEVIKFVLNNPKNAKVMVERGKRYIIDNLAWENIVNRIEEVYEHCLRNI